MPKHLKAYSDHQPRQGKPQAERYGGHWKSARAAWRMLLGFTFGDNEQAVEYMILNSVERLKLEIHIWDTAGI